MNESRQTLRPAPYDDEIDLRELFRVLWAGKWLIGGITFAATVIAVIIALILPNTYRAEALLAPNNQSGASGLSALAAQYGGLASLAGIDLGSRSVDKTSVGLQILRSRKFISEFIERHDILVPLMAAKGWAPETGELEIDPDDYDMATGKWVRNVRPPKKAIPSSQEAYDKFMSVLSVNRDKTEGFIIVAVQYYSPNLAKQWVDYLIGDLNAWMMHQDVAEAEQAIEYLSEQIESTSLADLKNVFYSLIEEQTKTIMLAKVSNEYLFLTLDPAVVPEEKYKPKRAFLVLLGAVIGIVLGIIFCFVGAISRKWRTA